MEQAYFAPQLQTNPKYWPDRDPEAKPEDYLMYRHLR